MTHSWWFITVGAYYVVLAMARFSVLQVKRKASGNYEIEKGLVSGFSKIEDKFVDAYLTKDGETVEEAKERLKKENK